jgi:HK97 family phage prohead protease
MGQKFDFSGWATRNNLKCSDGRTIMKDAFKDNDGQTVPLVWQHQHNDPGNVLGHALLENREEGVYTYGVFNDTEAGLQAKALVQHGDVTALSIYANKLQQQGGNVLHGAIREVSLVLAGANPGAYIDFPVIAHGDGEYAEVEDEATIYTGESIELCHEDSGDDYPEDEKVPENKKEKKGMAEEKTVKDVIDGMTEEQKNVMYFMIGEALKNAKKNDNKDDVKHDDIGGNEMKHNVFDEETKAPVSKVTPEDMKVIMADAKRLGSLKEAVLQHMESGDLVLKHDDIERPAYTTDDDGRYGIADIDYLFPEARNLNNPPEWIKRNTDWVAKVMNGVHHTPFSRIKSMFANITEDEARAKGYIKGNKKKNEVFTLLKRVTTPQTIYKKQKLDRDDIIDITDFDVVAWLRSEMRIMLDEEIARAILVGDGRLPADDDKISEDHIRPIVTDDDLYAVKVDLASNDAKSFIRGAIRARKQYKGSGNPVLFTTEDMLTEMLLLEDNMGHFMYTSAQALATVLRVREIITVPAMENTKYLGIIVNLNDYNVGADKGGAVSMFDDFDIDYNQQKYLIETRCSGALTKPYSALVIRAAETEPAGTEPAEPLKP